MREEYGKYTAGKLSSTLTYGKPLSIRDARNRFELSMTNSYSGITGNVKYFKNIFTGSYYRPLSEKVTFVAKARVGFLHEMRGTRSAHRFTLGGDGMLRGFDWCGVGPRVKRDENNKYEDSIGGTKFWSVSLMAKKPLSNREMGINGVLFLDMGSAWGIKNKNYKRDNVNDSHSMRASVGVSIEWAKCPFGVPIALVIGFPIKKKSFDRKQTITLDGVM